MNTRHLFVASLVALAGVTTLPTPAKACGGLFCDSAQPVNQAAERIIFSRNEDGTTTAVIEIQYSGPSENFAWMLPVQGSPTVGVSSNRALQALQSATNPFYQMTTTVEGDCRDDGFRASPANFDSAGGGSDAGASADSGAEPGVMVVASGSVGPYDYVTISVDPEAEDIATVATDWLNDNDFDVSPLGRDRLVPYLESGMNLIAFRLSKSSSAGSIRPIVLSFGAGLPSIPLRPTAAAATADMGIMVWVLGETRAIPANYAHLELNEARLNWFSPSANYNALVTLAANEAGGQGFVTEFAGDASPLAESMWPSFMSSRWEDLQGRDWTTLPRELIFEVSSLFSGADGLVESVLLEVPKPAFVSEEEWNSNALNLLYLLEPEDLAGFDPESFLARVESDVAAPIRDTAALFSAGLKATRFYTTMSPDEMTMDPVFDFNVTLADYSNRHVVERIIECNPDVSRGDARWRVMFDDGTVLRGQGNTWPLASTDELPANRRVLRMGNEGEGEVITDNTRTVAAIVSRNNASYPRRIPGRINGGGCSVSQTGGAGSALFLLALGGLFLRRRRGA